METPGRVLMKFNKYHQIIIDLETIIKYQNSLIWTLDSMVEAQNWRMWWYDSYLLEISETLESKNKKDIAKIRKIKSKIKVLLPKKKRRYGKHKSK